MLSIVVTSICCLGCEPGGEAPAPVVRAVAKPTAAWQPEAESREWRYVVPHHTATERGSVESIHESHLQRKWLGIGYHFLVGNGNGMPDGRVEPTFRWREQLHGAHAGSKDHNELGIGIALVGNFENHPPTAKQLAAVKSLVGTLTSRYGIDSKHVIAHRSVRATKCPGKQFPMDAIQRAARRADVSLANFEGPDRGTVRTGEIERESR